MSVIVKRQKKKDKGINFKITSRDFSDPLFNNPNAPQRVLVFNPTMGQMKNKNKLTKEQLELVDNILEDTNSYVIEADLEKDELDYAYEEFQRKIAEGEGEGDEDEGDYELEEIVVDAEGDEEYEFFGFNNKVDKEFAEEIKKNQKFKPAEGIKMVEYDVYGLPKTEEMEKIKREMNLRDEDVDVPEDANIMFIKPPEEFIMAGHFKSEDIKRSEMTKDMKEVHDLMETEEVQEEGEIDDDFIAMLNDGLPAVVEKDESELEAPKHNDFNEYNEIAEDEDEEVVRARIEADRMLMNMPAGLSEDMQIKLAGAREFLAAKNKTKEEVKTQDQIDNEFEEFMDGYHDNDIGAIGNDALEPVEDQIDKDAFDEVMQEFIEDNKEVCRDLYSKYHDTEYQAHQLTEKKKAIMDPELATKDFYKLDEQAVKLYEQDIETEEQRMREIIKQKAIEYEERDANEPEELDEIEEEPTEENQEEKWDVESILSTRTNTDNHPGIIKSVVQVKNNPILIDPKTKAPELENTHAPAQPKKNLEAPFIERMESDSDSDEGEGEGEQIDEKQELPDLEKMTEKERKKYLRKLNKKQVKKEKKERRVLKKEMKKEFAKEGQKYAKQNMQTQYRKIAGIK